MVIEFLKFKVTPELREKFIQKDAEIWTAALARYPGFLSKEVWIDPNTPAEVVMVNLSLPNNLKRLMLSLLGRWGKHTS